MYDVVIIGGGPGGLSAAIYCLRAKLEVLLVEKIGVGGQIALSDIIENYPGFRSVSGPGLMQKFEEHAKSFGLNIKNCSVEKIIDEPGKKVLKTDSGDIECRSIVIASGAKPTKLNVKGEDEFTGRGVSYCATCDGPFYNGRDIIIVGGGDTAVKEAIYLSKIAKKVSLVHRRDKLRAEKIMQDMLVLNPKVDFYWNSELEEILGNESGVTGAKVVNKENKTVNIEAEGVFIFVGIVPNSEFCDVDKDEKGFVIVNTKMETSMDGIFAIGDVRDTPLRQVATAVGDGAIAGVMVSEYVSTLKGVNYPKRT